MRRSWQYMASLFLSLVVTRVWSYATGAGGCRSGAAAVDGLHLAYASNDASSGNVQEGTNGTLIDAATVVWLNGITYEPNVPTFLATNTNVSFRIETFQVALLGLLIRIEAPSDANVDLAGIIASDNDSLYQDAAACDDQDGNVVGLTHRDASPKNIVNATIRLDRAVANLTIDITTVYGNNANLSVFAYDRFLLTFESTESSPSSSLTNQSTAPPPLAPPITAPTATAATIDFPSPAPSSAIHSCSTVRLLFTTIVPLLITMASVGSAFG